MHKNMHEKLCDVNNSFWKAYKEFLNDYDIPKWQDSVADIMERYNGDSFFYSFCLNLAFTWTPIINELKRVKLSKEKR